MKWFYDLKIRSKILLGFSLVILITAILIGVSINKIHEMDTADNELYSNMTVPLSYLQAISVSFQMIRVDTRDIIIASTKEQFDAKIKEIEERRKEILKNSEQFQKTVLSDEMRSAFDHFYGTRKEYIRLVDKVIALAEENKDQEATALLNKPSCT
ncbi:MAG: MCP four helix bundle domain-containing protein [Bacteroidota bacterium]|nr:MCP four helix bundle domain-containing protein [Bacteroidota bacterium]